MKEFLFQNGCNTVVTTVPKTYVKDFQLGWKITLNSVLHCEWTTWCSKIFHPKHNIVIHFFGYQTEQMATELHFLLNLFSPLRIKNSRSSGKKTCPG